MAFHKVIYAKCPYCKHEQPWAEFAAANQFSSGMKNPFVNIATEK